MCSFLSIQLEWHPAHMLSRCICFLTVLLLSMSYVLRGLKLQCAKSLALLCSILFYVLLLCFLLLSMPADTTLVCAVLWETCSLMFPVLPHADLLPTGILPSQWLDITRSLAELGEMENHPAAASITQGMTGIKSASWSRRSSLTSRWELQNTAHLPGYTALALVWFACSNLWIWKDEIFWV